MTVYKIDNVYHSEESLQQYIESNFSFADFLKLSLEDKSGGLRGLLNTAFNIWNSENQNAIVGTLNTLNQLYAGYVNNILSGIPRFTVIEGTKSEDQPTSEEVLSSNEETTEEVLNDDNE